MKLEEFNYDLPKELIAQEPAEPRDSCRLMMLDKKTGRGSMHNCGECRLGDIQLWRCPPIALWRSRGGAYH